MYKPDFALNNHQKQKKIKIKKKTKLVGCFILQHIKPFLVIYRRIKFQIIQFSKIFAYKQLNDKAVQLNVKTVPLKTIQFSISIQFSSFKKQFYFKQFSLA